MLIDDCGAIAAFRPPPVEQLSEGERRRLRARLAGVVDTWRGAAEIGLRLRELHQGQEIPEPVEGGADVWFHVARLPLALGLTPRAAVSLLCVNLGAKMPEEPDTALSEVDLALLDAWAARALPPLVGALDAGPAGEVQRRPRAPQYDGDAVVADLTFAAEMPAGRLVIGREIARKDRDSTAGERLGQHPELLLHARIQAHASITSEPVPICELLSLERGDVLLLGDKTTIEAELTAGSSVVATGRPGAREGVRALRIKGAVLNDSEDRLGATSDGF